MFSAKVPRSITHDKVLVDCSHEMDAFLESMHELGEKLGVLVFQFPYFPKEALEVGEFLERLGRLAPSLPKARYAVEVRNRDWIGEELFGGLEELRLAFVPTAFPGMPSIDAFKRMHAVTADFVYIRLLGDRIFTEEMLARQIGEVSFSETVIDRGEELSRWASWIEHLSSKDVSVYVYINNHYSGFAPRDIDDLKGRLGLEVVMPKPPPQSAFDF